jgi:hypothetical protein
VEIAAATSHSSVELHFPSRDRDGKPIDRRPWVDLAIKTMCECFGGAYEETVTGHWLGETRTYLREETSRIVSYAQKEQVRRGLPRLLDIAARFMTETNQEMVMVAVDQNPHHPALDEARG